MNTSNADYAFLEPTWKLPSLGSPSSQNGNYDRLYSSSGQKLDSDVPTWANTMPNSRYNPPNANHGMHLDMADQQRGDRSIPSGPSYPSQQQGQPFMQSRPLAPHPPPPPPAYQQQGQRFIQPGSAQSFQPQQERFMQSRPSMPSPSSYQPPGQRLMQPAPPQSFQLQDDLFRQSGPPAPPSQTYQQQGRRSIQPGLAQSFQPEEDLFKQSGPPAPPPQTYQQQGRRSIHPGLAQSFQPEEDLFKQSGLPAPPPQTYQQQGQRSIHPGLAQSFQPQEERFNQSGPPLPSSYQQPGQRLMQSGLSVPSPSSNRQPEQRFMQPAASQSFRPQQELFMQSGPPVLPPPPSHQQPWSRSQQPGPSQSFRPQEHVFIQTGPPIPPIRPSQLSMNTQYRNDENQNDDYGFFTNTNLNDAYNTSTQSPRNGFSNEKNTNRGGGFNYQPPSQPAQKRVQLTDRHQQALSADYISSRESTNSPSHNNHPSELKKLEQKSKPHDNQMNNSKLDSTHTNGQRPNNLNIHEYLYGLSAPDSGSYVTAYKNQRRRLQDERTNHKSVISEYKSFLQNGGFGPTFGTTTQQTREEKIDAENKRKAYSKLVHDVNQHKLEEQRRIQDNARQQRIRTHISPPPRRRRPQELGSHLLFSPEMQEFERKIKLEHDANCKCSLHAKPFDAFA